MTEHALYNTARFPHFVCHNGNWDVYADATGYCASIPTAAAAANGCKASHFGDRGYVRTTLGVDPMPAPAPVAMVAQPVQQAQGVVSLGGRYVALADGGVEWVPDAPAMVPQPVQQQQGKHVPAILNEFPTNLRVQEHTPGPFHVSDDLQIMKPTEDGPWLVLAHVLEQGDADDRHDGEGRVDPDTAYANALLFGAAPAMLAALKLIVAPQPYSATQAWRDNLRAARAAVEAAIAAAEGRS